MTTTSHMRSSCENKPWQSTVRVGVGKGDLGKRASIEAGTQREFTGPIVPCSPVSLKTRPG